MVELTDSKINAAKGRGRGGKKRKLSSKGVKVGGICPLDIEVPYGLFEAFDGAWYLITNDEDWKLAIVLAHSELPSFTCLRLRPRPLTGGRWWGAFHVLAGVATDDFGSLDVGLLSAEGSPKLSLQCQTPLVYTRWLDIGQVTSLREDKSAVSELGSEYRDWTIICADGERPVITRFEDGTVKLGRPRAAADLFVTHMTVAPERN